MIEKSLVAYRSNNVASSRQFRENQFRLISFDLSITGNQFRQFRRLQKAVTDTMIDKHLPMI